MRRPNKFTKRLRAISVHRRIDGRCRVEPLERRVLLSTTAGALGDGKVDLLYTAATGDVRLRFDADLQIVNSPPPVFTSVTLSSASGALLYSNFNLPAVPASPKPIISDRSFAFGANGLLDGADLGNVLPAHADPSFLLRDLTDVGPRREWDLHDAVVSEFRDGTRDDGVHRRWG